MVAPGDLQTVQYGRLMSWRICLEDFDIDFRYKKSLLNTKSILNLMPYLFSIY